MRSVTVAERRAMAAQRVRVYGKLEVSDPDALWVDVSTGLGDGAIDWFNSITLEDVLDAHCQTMRASVLRNAESPLSLAPLMEGSTLNVDGMAAYAPFLDVGRSWRASIAIVEDGRHLASATWRKVGEGTYDVVRVNSPQPSIELHGRDSGASLIDFQIATETEYSQDAYSNTDWGTCTITAAGATITFGSGTLQTDGITAGWALRFTDLSVAGNNAVWVKIVSVDSESVLTMAAGLANNSVDAAWAVEVARSMESTIQQLLDDNLGVAAITLYTPTSPDFVMYPWKQAKDVNLMEAINAVARTAGFVCRYRYDASDVSRLTLYSPDRAAGTEDFTLGPDEYIELPQSTLDLSGLRNVVKVKYYDEAANDELTVTATDATSVTRYGGPHAIPRVLSVDLAENPNINTSARATDLADLILLDLATPPFSQTLELANFWLAQLSDYVLLSANAVHTDVDTYASVHNIELRIEQGQVTSTMQLAGQPRGKYREWVTAYSPPAPDDLATLMISARITASTSSTAAVTVRVADAVNDNGVVTVTYAVTPIGTATLSTPASPQTIAALDITTDPATSGSVVINVVRGAVGTAAGQLIVWARRRGRIAVVATVEITPILAVASAEAITMAFTQTGGADTANNLYGTLAVADTTPRGTNSVSAFATEAAGATITSPTNLKTGGQGMGVTTADLATTGTVAVVIDRPVAAAPDGTIVFQAKADGRADVELTVTVPASLASACNVSAVVVAVADYALNTVLVTYNITGTYDHINVSLNSSLEQADGVVTIDVGALLGYDIASGGANTRSITATVTAYDAADNYLDADSSAATNFDANADF